MTRDPKLSDYYASRLDDPNQVTVHIGYESITDEDHENSPHMRQRITGVLGKHFKNTVRICSSSQDTHEALRICRMKRPKVAIISIRLEPTPDVSLYKLLKGLRELGIKIVVAYKESEAKADDERILGLRMVTRMRVKNIEKDFGVVLAALE